MLEICAFLLGCLVVLVLALEANAEDTFIGFGADIEHSKKPSMLCYSGGISRNLTWAAKAMIGVESGDVRYYAFYKNERCLLNGDSFNQPRSRYVDSRDESIGVSFEWRTHF